MNWTWFFVVMLVAAILLSLLDNYLAEKDDYLDNDEEEI